MKKFDALVCKPGPNQYTVDDSWKSNRPRLHRRPSPWDNASIQTVSCDASGNKYVLGPAVVQGTESPRSTPPSTPATTSGSSTSP